MTLYYYLALFVVALCTVLLLRSTRAMHCTVIGFFALQLGAVIYTALTNYGAAELGFFHFDALGLTYAGLMSFVGLLTAWRSIDHLKETTARHTRIYCCSLLVLSMALVGVYLSSNIAVNWIFLEATTLATAGLVYHRRSVHALEATWKYVFVSSVGIAIAYLGVLLLSTTGAHDLSYASLAHAVAESSSNPIYLKLAFLFIIIGYSTKLEVFPLFTVGVDANHSSPSPASAFISSALVAGGFVAIFRVYGVMAESNVYGWVMNLLLLVAVISLISSAVYMGRTSNYKRLLAYSTVENSGISLLGLALGGVGIFAALLHSIVHTFVKSITFLQLSKVGKLYGSYRVGRIHSYINVDRLGALVFVMAVASLIAAPPSVLFRSEYIIFKDILSSPRWWIAIAVILPLLVCAFWSLTKLLAIVFSAKTEELPAKQPFSLFSFVLLVVLLGLFVVGLSNMEFLTQLINEIIL